VSEIVDVAIVGGGMVGATLAVALGRVGMKVVVVDQADPKTLIDAAHDGRSSAIAYGTRKILEMAGVWSSLTSFAQPILDIRVTDGQIGQPASSLFLHYDHRILEDEAGNAEPLGHIVENTQTRRALIGLLKETPGVTLLAPMRVDSVNRDQGGLASVSLSDGTTIRAALVVAADGRNSRLRQDAGIQAKDRPYDQMGIVCTIAHPLPHGGTAHEHFLPSGPFAVLPMVDDEHGHHRSSLVWTERKDVTDAIMALDDQSFSDEMTTRFGLSLGPLTLASPRWSYPLGLLTAERYVDHRLALVGDAAHAIHPIAGQGLNLGLRDVAVLAEILVDARRLGMDIGTVELLHAYQSARRPDVTALGLVTDSLNKLFSNDIAAVRTVRDVGLAVVDRIDPVKRVLMKHAMGSLESPLGKLPRMAKGEAL